MDFILHILNTFITCPHVNAYLRTLCSSRRGYTDSHLLTCPSNNKQLRFRIHNRAHHLNVKTASTSNLIGMSGSVPSLALLGLLLRQVYFQGLADVNIEVWRPVAVALNPSSLQAIAFHRQIVLWLYHLITRSSHLLCVGINSNYHVGWTRNVHCSLPSEASGTTAAQLLIVQVHIQGDWYRR